jgi:hypothetical protein
MMYDKIGNISIGWTLMIFMEMCVDCLMSIVEIIDENGETLLNFRLITALNEMRVRVCVYICMYVCMYMYFP